jgi:tetratricopeptide (TPR) repeat protein
VGANAQVKRALLVALPLVFYLDALGGDFHFDDAHAVVENPAIRSLRGSARFLWDPSAFSVLPQNQNWRPALLYTYAATAQLTGVRAAPFIAVNLAVHIACVILLWLLVREVGLTLGRDLDRVAWLAAAIFAVHPLFSECVDYVSARSESLSAALSLGALTAWLRGRRGASHGLRPFAIAALLSALAVGTKLVAAIIPLLAALFEIAAPRPRRWRTIAWLLVPSAILAIVGARLTPPLARASASSFTRAEWFRSELPAILHYVGLFVWPMGQSADPDYPTAASFAEPQVWTSALVLLAAIAFCVYALRTGRRVGAALCIGWFLICIAPASSLFPLAEVVNEHRPYLAAAGLCVLAAAALEAAPGWLALSSRALVPLCALTLAVLGALTAARNLVWHDELTLWADVAAKAPRSARAQMNWGLALMTRGRMAEAEAPLREAVRLGPNYSYARINLGNWLLAHNDPDAVAQLDRAIQLQPNLFWAPYWRGMAAEKLGEPPAAAAAQFARAAELSPTFTEAWVHLAYARDRLGDKPGCVDAAARTVALRGSFDDRFLYAYALLKNREAARAQPILIALDREKPNDPKVVANLAEAKSQLAPR